MAQPTPYERAYNFANFQSTSPSDPLPGAQVDLELNLVKTSLDETQSNLALIQRDDGALANASVGFDQFKDEISTGFEPPTAWLTATNYVARDTVFINSGFYICEESHVSGVFADDLTAGKWTLIADLTSVTTGLPDETDALDYVRRNASNSAYEARSPSEVLTDIEGMASAKFPASITADSYLRGNTGGTAYEARSPEEAFDDMYLHGGDVAVSSGTLDLDAVDGIRSRITSSGTVSAVTLAEEKVRECLSAGSFTLTASASLIVNGSTSTNYRTVAGDLLRFEGYESGVVRVWLISSGVVDGMIVGRGYDEETSATTSTAIIPQDNTVPLVTEGTEILSLQYTPKSVTNRVRVRFFGWGSAAEVNGFQAAIFAGSTCIAAGQATVASAGHRACLSLEREHVPGVLTAVTYSVRFGPSLAGTLTLNGVGGATLFGAGTARSTLVVEEIKAS